MQTLNQIKNRLVGYLNSHAQLNQVVYGDNYKFAADRNLKYPVANCEWVESNVSGRLIGHTFRIILADRTNPNIEAIDDDIDSDMLLIADDFFAWLELQEGFILSKTSQIVKIVDEYGDRISGIRFRIILSTVRRANDCETPKRLLPPSIKSATFLINGDSQIYFLTANADSTDNVVTNTEHVETVTVTFSIITDVTDSEMPFASAYTIPEGFTVTSAVWSYSDYVYMYNITGSYDGLQDATFDFTSVLDVFATFSYNSLVDTDSMSVVAESPATYDITLGHITSINGTQTQVNITMPWLGGEAFTDDYDLPVGLELLSAFTYSGLYWNIEVGYTAENGLVFDFHQPLPNESRLFNPTYIPVGTINIIDSDSSITIATYTSTAVNYQEAAAQIQAALVAGGSNITYAFDNGTGTTVANGFFHSPHGPSRHITLLSFNPFDGGDLSFTIDPVE